jgi:hypothetical protein
MKKDNSPRIVFVITLVIFILLIGYFLFLQESDTDNEELSFNQEEPHKTEEDEDNPPQPVKWNNLLPAVREIAEENFRDIEIGESLSIWEEKDITGDNMTEALIYLGQGGAYTSYLTLARLEEGQPIIAEFKKKDDTITSFIFLEGASVMNGENIIMLPDRNVIYSAHWSRVVSGQPYGDLTDCGVEAYRWEPGNRYFEFSQELSDELREDYCQAVDVE